jgi:hypothetical protein
VFSPGKLFQGEALLDFWLVPDGLYSKVFFPESVHFDFSESEIRLGNFSDLSGEFVLGNFAILFGEFVPGNFAIFFGPKSWSLFIGKGSIMAIFSAEAIRGLTKSDFLLVLMSTLESKVFLYLVGVSMQSGEPTVPTLDLLRIGEFKSSFIGKSPSAINMLCFLGTSGRRP